MDFDLTTLVLSLLPSGVGYVLFTYGRKEHRWPQLVCGILLMVYPYFTGTVASMAGGGVLICAALYALIAAGY
jgi:hypothetical protein